MTEDRPLTEEEIKEQVENRVDKVNPEDFTAEEHAAVDAMAAKVVSDIARKKKFEGKRNRKAWNRMNRPEKIAAIDRGAAKIHAFLDKVLPKNPEPKTLEEVHELLDVLEETIDTEPYTLDSPKESKELGDS